MKVFSAILSIYILGLLLAPCSDVYAESNPETVILSADTHSHGADACTPFCFCECCQTLIQPAVVYHFTAFTTLIESITPLIITSESLFIHSFWRPPKD